MGLTMRAVPAQIEALPAPSVRTYSKWICGTSSFSSKHSAEFALRFEGFDLNSMKGDIKYNESSITVSNKTIAGTQLFHKCKVAIFQNLTLNK